MSLLSISSFALSLHTVAVDLVDSDQRTAAPLQFLNDLQDKVHPLFYSFCKQLPFDHSFLKVNPFPVVAQPLQLLVNLFQDRLVTASNRQDERSRPMKTLRVINNVSPLLYLTLHQSQPSFSMTSSKGGYPPIPPPRDPKRKHVILLTLFKRPYFSHPLPLKPWAPDRVCVCWEWDQNCNPFKTYVSSFNWI